MGSQYFPARSVLFQKKSSGVTYRVPALIYIPQFSCFLAFCEERLTPADAQAHLLVMRKGTFHKNYVEWKDMEVLSTARLEGYRSMNPCPVYDEFTGTVFLFFIAVLGHTSESYQLITGKNVTRLCYVSSSDQGETWSSVTDLTRILIGDTIKEWATFAVGPGHGTQLKSGRIIIPAYAYHIDCRNCFGRKCKTSSHSFCFYSDTHGKAWHFGEALSTPESVECQMVSVDEENGVNFLYCNARSVSGCRVQAVSFDNGAAFHNGQLVYKLVEPKNGCHGSVIGFPAPIYELGKAQHFLRQLRSIYTPLGVSISPPNFLPPTWVVYTHPTCSKSRRDLGVYLSLLPRDPDSWSGPWIIYAGPSAYSDMAYVVTFTDAPAVPVFACLFENGKKTAYDEISFCIFTMYELIDHLPHNNHKKMGLRKMKGLSECCFVC
ncbi:sialidase-4 [Carassius carassius]|uniref:sialidase-4 n=1 Tax=Carassius carassius TaxID=217509 RepID=UPI002868DDF3|nr:sialidase-4 [Carassius carassius]XP_059389977.1 sialidase-4 [Carassius carassius]